MTDKLRARASHQALAVPVEPVSRLDPSGFDPSRIAELATRCETEEGPDRELDIEIVVAIDWREPEWEEGERTAREMADKHGIAWLTSRSVDGFNSVWRHLPRFTASLDAAMMLPPDGCKLMLDGHHNIASVNRYWTPLDGEDAGHEEYRGEGATLALALCAAALRARAAIVDGTATAALCEDIAVPQDCQARAVRHRPDTPSLQTPQGGDS